MEIPNKTLEVNQNILSPMNILEYSDLTVEVLPNLQNGLFITPSDRQQVFNPKDYSMDGFGSFTVDKIPEEYVKPIGRLETKTYTPSKQEQRILAGQYLYGDQIISAISDDYVEKKFGLTKAGRKPFNLSGNIIGTTTEDNPKWSFAPDFVPKIVLFNLTANLAASSTITVNSSYTSLVSSFWVDSSIIPQYSSDNSLRKAGSYLYASNKVNVSRNNLGFEYSANKNIIFPVLNSSTRVAAGSVENGFYYEILYWG